MRFFGVRFPPHSPQYNRGIAEKNKKASTSKPNTNFGKAISSRNATTHGLFYRDIEQSNLRRSQAAMVLSDFSCRELLRVKYPDAKITVVPGGTDTEQFQAAGRPKAEVRRGLDLPENRPTLLSIRHLAPRLSLTPERLHAYVAEHYTWDKHVTATEAVYENARAAAASK